MTLKIAVALVVFAGVPACGAGGSGAGLDGAAPGVDGTAAVDAGGSGVDAIPCDPAGGLGPSGPCIDRALIPAPRAGHGTVRLDTTTPVTSNTGEAGAFRHRCDFSHMNFDDAVLFRDRPGAAHLHTYFGNTGTDATSTSDSLETTGDSTCAGGIFNRSAYWVPSMVDTRTGRPIAPSDPRTQYHSDLEVYYKLGYQGVGYLDVRPFPNGLQLIAGNASGATVETPESRVHYWCENDSQLDRINLGASIPTCAAGQILSMGIDFPQCWDGVNLTTLDGRSHLAYGTWQPGTVETSVGCPASHPVGLPHIEMFVRYHVQASDDTSAWRLSSDHYADGPGGFSGHADYVFAWDEDAFETVVERCYNTLFDCGFQLGDGREPRSPRF